MTNKSHFEWDETKNQDNQKKHGIPFEIAQYAFADQNRIILEDFAFLVQDFGERGKIYMKKNMKYTDEPMDNVKITKDFLPSPEELIFKDKTVKVTIALSQSSVDYFKQVAKSYNTQYQKMIRRLLDEYVSKQKIAS